MKKSPPSKGLILLLTLFLAGLVFVTGAGAANEGNPIAISIEQMDQQNPDVVALPDQGLWFVVWEDWRTAAGGAADNTGADIWGQFVDGNGEKCGEPILISDADEDTEGDLGNQTFPRVAYDQDDGRLLVVWQDTRNTPGHDAGSIYARGINVTSCSDYELMDEQLMSYNPLVYWNGTTAGLLARTRPRLSYDPTRDQFWLAWVENRSFRKRVTGHPFYCALGGYFDWTVGDTSFVAYAALDSDIGLGDTTLPEIVVPDVLHTGPVGDRVENARLMSRTAGCTEEVLIYEFFDSVNNVDIGVDPSSGEVLLAWEGIRRIFTVTNTSDEPDGSPTDCYDCGADPATSYGETSIDEGDSGLVNIHAIHKKEIPLEQVPSIRISDADDLAYRPSAMADPVTGRFIIAWEDLRDYALYTKIYGQLVYSGGGLYNTNFIIGYQDTNGDGELDEPLRDSRQTSPYVGYDHTNQRFFVAWQDGRNGSISVENLDIYGQYVDAEGSLRGSNYLISASSDGQSAEGNQYSPAIAFNLDNHLFLGVWKDARNFSTTRSDIYGQRFTIGQPQLAVLNMDNSLLSPALIDFGSRLTGEQASASFKIRNTGDTSLDLTNLSALAAPFSYLGLPGEMRDDDGVGMILVPSAELTVTVAFAPTASGSFQEEILIESNAGDLIVRLQGIGLQQSPSSSSVSVNPSELSFGSVAVGNAEYLTVQLQNDGTTDVNLIQVEKPAEPFSGLGLPGGGTIKSGEVVNFAVKFAPDEGGSFHDRLVFIFRETSPVIIELSGTGSASTNPAVINFSQSSVNFGEVMVGEVKSFNVSVTNTGGQPSTVLALDVPTEGFEVSNFSTSTDVTPGETEYLVIRFMPTEAKSYSGTIAVLMSHRAQPLTVSVLGTGIDETQAGDAALAFSTNEVVFSPTVVDQSRSYHLTVTNSGTGSARLLSMDVGGGLFDIDGLDPEQVIEPGETVHCILTFSPDAEGVFRDEMRFFFEHLMDPVTVSLEGQGVSEEDYEAALDQDNNPPGLLPWNDPTLQKPVVILSVGEGGKDVEWEFIPNDYVGAKADRYLVLVTPWIDPWTGGLLFYSRLADASFAQGLVPEAPQWTIGQYYDSAASLEALVPAHLSGGPGRYYLFFGVITPDRLHAYYDWISWTW
jgi:hypothetical protein